MWSVFQLACKDGPSDAPGMAVIAGRLGMTQSFKEVALCFPPGVIVSVILQI